MLKDEVTIKARSGKGGRGSMAILLNRLHGGDGGDGGNVYLEGDENIYDLNWYDQGKTYKAGHGEDGHKRHKSGSNGADLILKLPLVTAVYIDGKYEGSISEHGQREHILIGGKGSLGNISLRKNNPDWQNELEENVPGEGREVELKFVLKLRSDVIFIGYPNAGKSSLLNSLTNTDVKTADYAFTTLEPQLGMMDGILLMDLPGLIEGTSEGKGLGTRFVKHTETARLVAHTVSLENPEPWDTYITLRNELLRISPELAAKPELIILTKSDTADEQKISKTEETFRKAGLKVQTISIIDDEALAAVKELIKSELANI